MTCRKSGTLILALVLIFTLMTGYAYAEEDDGPPVRYESGDYTYTLNEDNEACIVRYRGEATDEEIPSILDGYCVTSIGDSAFSNCALLSGLTIPDSVTSIEGNPFAECRVRIYVSPEHTEFAVIDGVLFGKSDKRLIAYPVAKTAAEYSIPNGIVTIGDAAFAYCETLSSITIPDSVTSIGDRAFCRCTSLSSITIPDSVMSIGGSIFWDCASLSSITIPDSVTSIGRNPFTGCVRLSVHVSPENAEFEVIDGVLFGKSDKCLITYPAAKADAGYTIPNGILSIGEDAFSKCTSLSSITIPDSVTSIGNGAFAYCETLSSITIPESVTSISNLAFFSCASLSSITIPESVTSIGRYGFFYCAEDLTLTVTRDSYAAAWAEENDVLYQYTDSLDWLNS